MVLRLIFKLINTILRLIFKSKLMNPVLKSKNCDEYFENKFNNVNFFKKKKS